MCCPLGAIYKTTLCECASTSPGGVTTNNMAKITSSATSLWMCILSTTCTSNLEATLSGTAGTYVQTCACNIGF